ncbi:MAG: quinone-dependent dihydroorotate dehydrogenase [Hyphomicrobiales bacterium]|nr:quinone-dependent dihydroorotate dehydrogenase [Hyphomicrobiales bacterium]
MMQLARAVLLALEPEQAHCLTLQALKLLPPQRPAPDDPCLGVNVLGLAFPNPLGMAAGFDKNAEVHNVLLRLGFGFTEIGTVTPLSQPGNPRPRVFRLPAAGAVINRLGFNGAGHAAALAHLKAAPPRGIVGVNIGANKLSTDRPHDYLLGIAAFAAIASYFTINISSPNTPGLRDLQGEAELDDLLARIQDARAALPRRPPVLLKIAPDLTLAALDAIVQLALKHRLDGMIVANTTVQRPQELLHLQHASETGGLSGRPLMAPSTRMLAETFARAGRQLVLIGVGGIDSGATAYAKICAGADLVQLYTGIIYQGPGLIAAMKRDLIKLLARDGHTSINQAVGTKSHEWVG